MQFEPQIESVQIKFYSPRPPHLVDTYDGAEPPLGGSQLVVAQLFNMTTQCHTLEQGGRSWQAFGERKDALISFIGSVFAILRQNMCFLQAAAGTNNRPSRFVRSEKGKITMWKKMRQYLNGDKNPLNHDL